MRPGRSGVGRFRSAAAAAVALAAACFAAMPAPAAAEITGPCTASIAGQSITDRGTGATSDPIVVDGESPVIVTMGSSRPMTHLKVMLSFAGLDRAVKEEETTSSAWAESVPVDDYATYGK